MKNTALTQFHERLNARMVEFAGYNMPLEYEGVIKEHLAVRESAGVFDVSHMGEFWVIGPGALQLLQEVTSNDVSKLIVGQAQYTCLPNGMGGIVDDLIVYKYEDEKYMLVVNASNIEKDWAWISSHNSFGAILQNASDEMSLIALQGPKSEEILQALTGSDLSKIKSFHFITDTIAESEEVIISATGYTGAGGFELYCYNQDAPQIWSALFKAGEKYNLKPAGLAARDTLRLEMGYALYGNDIDDKTSPMEAGLGWIVKFDKANGFIDKARLKKEKEEGLKQKLVGIKLIDRGIPRKGYQIVNQNDELIGEVTSGTQSPVLQIGIGMAYIKIEYAFPGNEVYLLVRNRKLKAEVVKFPFI